jgi:hypothetical protein
VLKSLLERFRHCLIRARGGRACRLAGNVTGIITEAMLISGVCSRAIRVGKCNNCAS